VDLILSIRQMMADSRFFEAQKLAEASLPYLDNKSRLEIIPDYLEILLAQNKELPLNYLLEIIENSLEKNFFLAIKWQEQLPNIVPRQYFLQTEIIRIKFLEKKGKLDSLCLKIRDLKIALIEMNLPIKIDFLEQLIEKYFKDEFEFKILKLVHLFQIHDLSNAENFILKLLKEIKQKATQKNLRGRIQQIGELIKGLAEKKQLDLYQSFCTLYVEGISEKSDFKKIAELVIYAEDFEFQVLVLDLLIHLNLDDLAVEFSVVIRGHKKYKFIYISKYFPHLKPFFVFKKEKEIESENFTFEIEKIEVSSTPEIKSEVKEEKFFELNPDEELMTKSLKYQDLTSNQLIELSSSLIQSEYFRAACMAANLALKMTNDEKEYLKACYLKITSLFFLGDFRSVLDLGIEAINKSKTEDDILSFLYIVGESYFEMGLNEEALITFGKIISINPNYRKVQLKIKALNEV
jgi:hypothetical protein